MLKNQLTVIVLTHNSIKHFYRAVGYWRCLKYMVIVVDDLGDTITATVVIGSTGGTSIADHNELSVSVYPNPNNGHFSIEYSNISYGEDILLIYNSLGQILVRELLFSNRSEFDLHEIGAGVYNLKLISGNQMISRNIVVH